MFQLIGADGGDDARVDGSGKEQGTVPARWLRRLGQKIEGSGCGRPRQRSDDDETLVAESSQGSGEGSIIIEVWPQELA